MKVKVSYTVDLEEIPNVVRHMVNSTHDMQDEIAELTSQLSRGDLGVKSLKNLDRLREVSEQMSTKFEECQSILSGFLTAVFNQNEEDIKKIAEQASKQSEDLENDSNI